MLASVLVPVLDEEDHVRAAVAGMRAQCLDGEFELIFLDGGSRDRTRAILEELAGEDERIRVLGNPARRTPNALNIGLGSARGEFVARMDAHSHYPPDYLAQAIERLRRGDVAHVSGPQLAQGQGRWSRRTAIALSSPLGTGGAAFRREGSEELEVDSGFTGVWRRSTLERHGGWDEGWPKNQDGELAARIKQEGGRLVCLPGMAARYVPRNSLRALARQYWHFGIYRAKTVKRHPGAMRRSQVLAPGLAVCVVAGLLPGRAGIAPRLGLSAYGLALGGAALAAVRGHSPGDAASLPLVLAVMHLSWGFGFLVGCARFGAPVAALAGLVRH